MKYAMTRDWQIFEVAKDLGRYGTTKAVLVIDPNGNVIDLREQNNILKEADNLEELCDEFLLVGKDGSRCFVVPTGVSDKYFYSYDEGDDTYNFSTKYYELEEGEVFKGMIWTDKGLIYVIEKHKGGKWKLL